MKNSFDKTQGIKLKKFLLVTPAYPKEGDIYKNPFLHPRVKSYLARGLSVDVFSLENSATEDYTYDGVFVRTGGYAALAKLLEETSYEKIMVHFLLKKQVEFLRLNALQTPLFVYVHGYDVMKWQRRKYLFEDKPLKQLAFILWTNMRMSYVRHFLFSMRECEKIIFVSEYLKNIVEKDFGINLAEGSFAIVNNPVSTELFHYSHKDPKARFKIVSVRPYHNLNYGNDISVECVKLLSKKDFFSLLSFDFYGDGKLFDSTLSPIKDFPNVKIHKGFLSQKEISSVYENCGVFLSPARAETQGLARCEAAYCGLIPLTSDIGAVGEFMKSDFAFLTSSPQELADALEKLCLDENLFLSMSKRAHEYVKERLSSGKIAEREAALLLDKGEK